MEGKIKPISDNDNNVREYYLKWRAETEESRSRKRVVGVGNINNVSEMALHNLAQRLSEHKPFPKGIANAYVYAISDENARATKIGYALSPVRRLAELQTGNPNRLIIYRAFLFGCMDDARQVEYCAHKIADARYRRMVGEWFKCTPYEAHQIVDEASDNANVIYCAFTPIVDREASTPRLVA